jgi:hypothetical protein
MYNTDPARKNTIHLEQWEVEFCNDLGISLQTYARRKSEDEKERIKHEQWLQTPAGATYMAKRRAAYEKRLARNRASAKALRAKRKEEKSACGL